MFRNTYILILLGFLSFFSFFLSSVSFAEIQIPGENLLQGPSIHVDASAGNVVDISRDFGFRILGIAKLVISGFALIYIVLMWVYMVVFSDNEEKIKTQKNQVIYVLIGFLFLNVPWLLYPLFFSSSTSTTTVGDMPSAWSGFMGGIFWNSSILDSTLSNIIAFFQVFIFWVAVLMFTWGLFLLILSSGDEERVKSWKNRLIYGVLGLLFLGFVKVWWSVIASADFINPASGVWTVWKRLFAISIYFAGPVAIFFLILWAYYYITSGGDEERVKKWKAIIINTFIATLLLLASYSFLTELQGLTF